MALNYPWYNIVKSQDDLNQGDFLDKCPIIIPPDDITLNTSHEVKVKRYNVIILSQSCDLVQKKLDLVLVCPVYPLEYFGKRDPQFKKSKGKEKLRRGEIVGYHLLDKCELHGLEKDYQVVDFRSVFSIPFESITGFAKKQGKRLRLLPPYREHLSQAFARFFMRVGLPVDIPSFI